MDKFNKIDLLALKGRHTIAQGVSPGLAARERNTVRGTQGLRPGLGSVAPLGLFVFLLVSFFSLSLSAAEERTRELFVPETELAALLESATDRVLLKRNEYETLLQQAREIRLEQTRKQDNAPAEAVLLAADYVVNIVDGRAIIDGTLDIDVLTESPVAISLPLQNVALLDATLDGEPAPLGNVADGMHPRLFVHGKKKYRLEIRATTPLTVDATRQELRFLLPRSPQTPLKLSVPGDVELKSGAAVVNRTVDSATKFDLLLPSESGETHLLLTLNSHRAKQTRTVMARSVQFAELTEQYRKLHATVSLDVLHQGIDSASFVLPKDYEPTEVHSPMLNQWTVTDGILHVKFREPVTGLTTLNIAAIETATTTDGEWNFPVLEPLDVAANSAVAGLFVDEELDVSNVATKNLLPIDAVVKTSLAESLRPAFAWYAPQGTFSATANFVRPGVKFDVNQVTNLTLSENEPRLQTLFSLKPTTGNIFDVKLNVPKNWKITHINLAGTPVSSPPAPLEFTPSETGVEIKLPKAVRPGEQCGIVVSAVGAIDGWFNNRYENPLAFPVVEIQGAENVTGIINVIRRSEEDFEIIPTKAERLIPLDKNEKQDGTLAYRFTSSDYNLEMRLEKSVPRIKAKTFSFYKLEPKLLSVRYEIEFNVEQARTRTLSFRLPVDTPQNPTIKGLNGLPVKEYFSHEIEENGEKFRRWDIVLARPMSGTLKLSVDFETPLENPHGNLTLPPLLAENAAWQAGFIAVEGDEELDIAIPSENLRIVDAGEIAACTYQPGKRLLGAFSLQDEGEPITVQIQRNTPYDLATSLIRNVDVTARIADENAATVLYRVVYDLQTKAMFVKSVLEPGSELWSATLDGRPIKPQRDGDELILTIPADLAAESRRIELIYRAQSDRDCRFPSLTISGQKIPVLRTHWNVVAPTGFRITRLGDKTIDRPDIRPALFDIFFGTVDALSVLTRSPNLEYSSAGSPLFENASYFGRRPTSERSKLGMASIPIPVSPYWQTDNDGDGIADNKWGVFEGRFSQAPAGTPAFRDEVEGKGQWHYDGSLVAEMPESVPQRTLEHDKEPEFSNALSGTEVRYEFDLSQRGRRLQTVQPVSVQLQDNIESGHTATLAAIGDRNVQSVSVQLSSIETERRIFVMSFLSALLVGLCALRISKQRKSAMVFGAIIICTLFVCLPGLEPFAPIFNGIVFGTVLGVVPLFFVAGIFKKMSRGCSAAQSPDVAPNNTILPPITVTTILLLIFTSTVLNADEPEPKITIPADAIVVPYSIDDLAPSRLPTAGELTKQEQQLLVPSKTWLDMLDLLKTQSTLRQPVVNFAFPFAVTKAEYKAALTDGGEDLQLNGTLRIDVFVSEKVLVPLRLENGVFGDMKLDGKPATLRADGETAASLLVEGKGTHELTFSVRTKIQRQGGWRIAAGTLPSAATAKVLLTLDNVVTDLLTSVQTDKTKWTALSDENRIIETTLSGGGFRWQWRSAISEATVDRSLEVESAVRFDVQEDGLRLHADIQLNMSRGKWETFRLRLPKDYVITAIDGDNVRGWTLLESGDDVPFTPVDIELLKPAEKTERLAVKLWKSADSGNIETEIPRPEIVDASIHRGRVDIFRSPQLDVRVTETIGVTQTDRRDDVKTASDSPLGIVPLQSFQFGSDRYKIAVSSKTTESVVTATVRSILKLSKHETALETKIDVSSPDRPLYEIAVQLPQGFDAKNVTVPAGATFVRPQGDEPLVVYLATGIRGNVELLFHCHFDRSAAKGEISPSPKNNNSEQNGVGEISHFVRNDGMARNNATSFPRFIVTGSKEQRTELVVQTDPSLDVHSENLTGCRAVPLGTVFGWLRDTQQRELARLAFVAQTPEFDGDLVLTERQAEIRCDTISNVRTTAQAVEETILLDFSVTKSGVRVIEFSLPNWMRDASIEVPMLQRKIVTAAEDESSVAVRLELQDDVMGQLRVLVRADRKLQTETDYRVSVPIIATGRTGRQYIVMENDRRSPDEMVVDPTKLTGLRPLSRQQTEWAYLASLLGNGATEAYLGEQNDASLTFRMKRREALKISDARIDLAETRLVVGENGVYLGEQIYRIDNKKEPYLDLRLPLGATIWGVRILTAEEWTRKENGERGDFGQPVKACLATDNTLEEAPEKAPEYRLNGNSVRIPLVKTESGDLDYVIRIVYGGESNQLRNLSKIDFPFPEVLNIPVGRSLVRLHLPDNFRYRFDGNLRYVEQERTTEARRQEETAYLQRQTDRLQQATQSDNVFAQNRAKFNLAGQVVQLGRPLIDPSGTSQLALQPMPQSGQGQMMVTPQVVIQEDNEELGGAIFNGNDARMSNEFSQQQNAKASNLVLSGQNFYVGKTITGSGNLEPESKTVSVPDGGTVLLGGIPRTTEKPQQESGVQDAPTPSSQGEETQSLGGRRAQPSPIPVQEQTAGSGGAIYNDNKADEAKREGFVEALRAVDTAAIPVPESQSRGGAVYYFGGRDSGGAVERFPSTPQPPASDVEKIDGNNVTFGLNGPMNFTADLSVPFSASNSVIPQSGGYTAPDSVVMAGKGSMGGMGGMGGATAYTPSPSVHGVQGAMGSRGGQESGVQYEVATSDLATTPRAMTSLMGSGDGALGSRRSGDSLAQAISEAAALPPPVSVYGVHGAMGTRDGQESAKDAGLADFTILENLIESVVVPDSESIDKKVTEYMPNPSLAVRQDLTIRTASLDIEIPYSGREFLFTTPQGTLELSARCFADETSNRWLTVFVALVGIGGVYGIYRLCVVIGRRMTFDRRTHRNVAGLVTLLGCLALPLSIAVFAAAMVGAAVLWAALLKRNKEVVVQP